MSEAGWATPEEKKQWKEQYEAKLIADARNGDPEARYAVAGLQLDGARVGTEKRQPYFLSAGAAGLGDGYYQDAKDFELSEYEKNNSTIVYESPESICYYDFIQKCADKES